MGILIMIDLERVEENFEELFKSYFEYKGWKADYLEVVDTDEYVNYTKREEDTQYDVFFTIESHDYKRNEATGKICPDFMEFNMIHQQYDFNSKTLYGFFEVVGYSCGKALQEEDFITYLSNKSRDK